MSDGPWPPARWPAVTSPSTSTQTPPTPRRNTRCAISVEQVKEWCAGTDTHVTVRLVIDLNTNLHTDAYRPTELQREQAIPTNPSCVYPHCTRPSRSADLDHVVEPERGGPTDSTNLAPLRRGHHRCRTHFDWDTRHPRHTH